MAQTSTLRRLYTGEGGVNFVGRRRLWYTITLIVLFVSMASMGFRGFQPGIDFTGGTKIYMPAAGVSKEVADEVFENAIGVPAEKSQIVGAGDGEILEIHSKRLNDDQISEVREALYDKFQPKDADGEVTPDVIGDSTVSESWGSTITDRMLMALGVFFVLIFFYIMVRFERDMAIAAMCGIAVDAVVIAGIYSLIGFEVTPATVIGLLTVLAFSLYDTVVVFDKVKENTAGFLGTYRKTYAEHANLAVNQTVMRSVATTVISALPIASLMVIAVWLMGVGTLKDLALVQLIGVIEGTFSSVFLATPILVSIKNRQKKIKEHTAKVESNREQRGISVDVDGNVTAGFDASAHDDVYEQSTPAEKIVPRRVSLDSDESLGASWRPGRGDS